MGAARRPGCADVAIVTDDNPRNEDPAAIRAEVLAGGRGLLEDRRPARGHRRRRRTAAGGRHAGRGRQGPRAGPDRRPEIHPFDDVAETRRRARNGQMTQGAWTEPLWTSDEIVAATGGTRHGAPFDGYWRLHRHPHAEPGDLFVALAGERDGHDFVAAARARGAAGVLASRPVGRTRCPRRRHPGRPGASGGGRARAGAGRPGAAR